MDKRVYEQMQKELQYKEQTMKSIKKNIEDGKQMTNDLNAYPGILFFIKPDSAGGSPRISKHFKRTSNEIE